MRVLDASSIIYAWDNYPIGVLPRLWDWLAEEIREGRFAILDVALGEVRNRLPECSDWLIKYEIERHPVTPAVLNEALRIKGLLGIQEDNYHPKGVSENDLMIIADARLRDVTLVTNEGFQTRPPDNLAKSKIPTVCNMPVVAVDWEAWIDVVNSIGRQIG